MAWERRSFNAAGNRSGVRGIVAGACVAVLATGCVADSPSGSSHSGGKVASPAPVPASAARISITPTDGEQDALPQKGIRVTVADGRLTHVIVDSSGEDPVIGGRSHGEAVWHSRWALDVDTDYTVRATAIDDAGLRVTQTSSFHTLAPSSTFRTTIFEGYAKAYGVGMPVILQFSEPIEYKKKIERSLRLWSSKPVVGAWYWDGDQTLYFRPRDYWPVGAKIHFEGHLNGLQGAPGVYGYHTLTQSFRIGRSLIAVANTRNHHVHVYRDKKLFGDWPMSSGRPGLDTPNGTYLTIEKSNPEEMVGPGYDIQVPWSVRFTWSGNFLHDAYWSVNDQGFDNVSHGCVNLSPENAETYYKMAVPGDPVTIKGSPRDGAWGDGWTVWFIGWKDLLEGSATHQAVKVGPDGSTPVDPATLKASHAKAPLGRPPLGNADATA